MIQLSLVIVTWNCARYLDEFFTSIRDLVEDPATQIIVVDNDSTDGGPEFIAARYPSVQLIRGNGNVGFAKGNNIGLAAAKGELICLINPDVKVLPGCFQALIAFIRQHPDVGLLGPRMLNRNGVVDRSTMRLPTIWNCLCQALALDVLIGGRWFSGQLMRDFAHDHTREVEVLNGWFLLTRREALATVGNLDERFFMYGEDIDFSKRFRDAGWKNVYFAEASAIHYGGGSSRNAPVRFYIEQQKANLQYFKKHHGLIKRLGFLMTVWLYEVVRLAGHSISYVSQRQGREETGHKIRRSAGCIKWLLGMSHVEGVR